MPRFSIILFLIIAAVMSSQAAGPASAGPEESGPISLKVKFWVDATEITGAMPDRKTADRLLIAIFQALPDKPIFDRLVIDPRRSVSEIPSSADLAGLLLELALSTRDGCLEITERELIVSGLTDSLVTQAAFDVRLRPFVQSLGNRELKNQIALVKEEDLEPDRLPRRPRMALDAPPLKIAPVELADTAYGPPDPLLRAIPLVANASSAPSPVQAESESQSANTAALEPEAPAYGYEPLNEIRFHENSFLVGSDQLDRVQSITDTLKNLPPEAGKVILRGHPDNAGKHTYNDWLTVSRLKAVRRELSGAGIADSRLRFESNANPTDRKHLGTVSVLIPRLTPPDPPPVSETSSLSNSEESGGVPTVTDTLRATPVPATSLPQEFPAGNP